PRPCACRASRARNGHVKVPLKASRTASPYAWDAVGSRYAEGAAILLQTRAEENRRGARTPRGEGAKGRKARGQYGRGRDRKQYDQDRQQRRNRWYGDMVREKIAVTARGKCIAIHLMAVAARLHRRAEDSIRLVCVCRHHQLTDQRHERDQAHGKDAKPCSQPFARAKGHGVRAKKQPGV